MALRSEKSGLLHREGRKRGRLTAIRFSFVILLVFVCVTFSCAGRAQLAPLPPEHGEDRLSGVVLNSVTHEPIGRALVLSSDNRFAMFTDDRGRFAFTFPAAQTTAAPTQPVVNGAIDPSQLQNNSSTRPLQWRARKVGFIFGAEGQDWVDINPDQPELTLALTPEAHIVGRVTVPGMDGSNKMQVQLCRSAFQEGRQTWEPVNNVTTRADGTFRIAELRPGSYKLLTLENLDRNPLDRRRGGVLLGYPPVYYPGASDFSGAAVIQLKAGEIFQASISPAKREYYPVNLPFVTPLVTPQVSVEVWAQGHPGPGYSLGYDPREGTIRGFLPNGGYTVQVKSYGPGVTTGGVTNFTVAGAAVTGPAIPMVQGISISVRVHEELQQQQAEATGGAEATVRMTMTEGSGSFPVPPNLRRHSYLQVALEPDEQFGLATAANQTPAKNEDDDGVVIENVLPGRYRVVTFVPYGAGYAASISSGGTDLLKQPLVVVAGGPVPSIEVTVRNDGAELDGTAAASTLTAENYGATKTNPAPVGSPQGIAYLVPIDKIDARPKVIFCDSEGNFMFSQVAPGAYNVFAIASLRTPMRLSSPMRWFSEEWLKQHQTQVQTIQLFAGQKAQVRLPLITESE